jgi:alcohol dehydrogenase (cytochrome c)
VAGLRTAWSWSLPPGGNMMTPIVRDGVLYAYSFGDIVEALDATNGELLWRFQRPLDGQATAQGKKGVALAGSHVIVPTSDLHVVALDAKTGAVAWDHKIDVGAETHFQIKSSPLVTKTKVIIGVNGFAEVKGGNFIVALDLATGKEAWRFYTVARPGEPGGESWNGLPLEQRSGGSVWVAGSYDPQSNLAFFGAAPTYNSMPLRKRSTAPGITNDALYTDATLALDADTGKLKWFYQHQKNDQLDHDWVYERQILDMRVDGRLRRVVVTGGKQAIFEALDAQTGAYLFSIDLDMQNVISAIDPKTGEKTINPAAIPRPDEALRRISLPNICPDLLGARNLMSTSYDPRTRLLFVPLTDTCMNPFPNGARWQKHPEPGSDGLFGVLKAVDLQGKKVVWTSRVKGPFVSGALATGGDLVFAGTVDRYFRAFDSRNGKELWRARLDNAPASYPVTYRVDGRQYIAVATNEGFVQVEAMAAVAKERRPLAPGATLWVFELPARP